MRYLIVAALGLLIGTAAGAVAIYYNPLIEAKSSAEFDAAARALHYSLPSEVLGFALGEQVVPPGTPKQDGLLWEETIERSAMLSLVLDDVHDKPTAIASRMLAVSPRTDFVLSGVRVNDYWLLTIPGEGTLFLRADANVWPFLKQTLPVWYLGRPWKGPTEYSPTAGPGEHGEAVVVGATGRFAGLEGTAIEKYRLTDLDPAARSAAATGEIDFKLGASQVAKSE
jgi:hypothetical protein